MEHTRHTRTHLARMVGRTELGGWCLFGVAGVGTPETWTNREEHEPSESLSSAQAPAPDSKHRRKGDHTPVPQREGGTRGELASDTPSSLAHPWKAERRGECKELKNQRLAGA